MEAYVLMNPIMFSFSITLRCINSINCRIYALSLISLVNDSQVA